MGYINFKGISTEALPGVYVSKMPSHKRAAMRYSEFYVNGRDGALHIENGYQNIQLSATLVLLDAPAQTRYAVNTWASGKGTLFTSDDPSKGWRARVLSEVRWDRVVGNYGFYDTATITFDCDPTMYEVNQETIDITNDGADTKKYTVHNPGDLESYPIIYLNSSTSMLMGHLKITVNGKEADTNVTVASGSPAWIDGEAGFCYTGLLRPDGGIPDPGNLKAMTGTYPVLKKGDNEIQIPHGEIIKIYPNWRWL